TLCFCCFAPRLIAPSHCLSRGSGRHIVPVQMRLVKVPPHVRFGSKADMCNAQAHVRFTPESDIKCDIMESYVRFNLEIGLPPIIAVIESYTSRPCSPALKR